MSNFTKVSWNYATDRYELHIDGVLKAYENGTNDAEHEEGARQLSTVAKVKGYDVHFEKRKEEK